MATPSLIRLATAPSAGASRAPPTRTCLFSPCGARRAVGTGRPLRVAFDSLCRAWHQEPVARRAPDGGRPRAPRVFTSRPEVVSVVPVVLRVPARASRLDGHPSASLVAAAVRPDRPRARTFSACVAAMVGGCMVLPLASDARLIALARGQRGGTYPLRPNEPKVSAAWDEEVELLKEPPDGLKRTFPAKKERCEQELAQA